MPAPKKTEPSTAQKTKRAKSAFARPTFTKPAFSAAPKKTVATPSKTLTPAALAKKLAAVEAAKKLAAAVGARQPTPVVKTAAVVKKQVASRSGTDCASMTEAAAEPAAEVVFTYSSESPEPCHVFVAGDFNGWNPQAHPLQLFDGSVYRTVLRLAPGTYQYKFVVDGTWVHDSRAESHADNEHGTLNSVVRV